MGGKASGEETPKVGRPPMAESGPIDDMPEKMANAVQSARRRIGNCEDLRATTSPAEWVAFDCCRSSDNHGARVVPD